MYMYINHSFRTQEVISLWKLEFIMVSKYILNEDKIKKNYIKVISKTLILSADIRYFMFADIRYLSPALTW